MGEVCADGNGTGLPTGMTVVTIYNGTSVS